MSTTIEQNRPLVLITGATGYIGGRLLRPLLEAGYRVRAGVRRPEILAARWGNTIEVARFDAFQPETVRAALRDVGIAYYLVHSLRDAKDYSDADRKAAGIFASAARDAGVRRIIYLGGLGEGTDDLSEHLASRQEVGRILAGSGVETIEFRASIVIGSGSTSYEMIRNLVEKLPVIPAPHWVRAPAQPIAIEDVAAYLVAAAGRKFEGSQIFQIGGPDATSYQGIMLTYAKIRGLKRTVIPVWLLSPRLAGWLLAFFTPAQAKVGRHLAESLRHSTTVTDDAARTAFPDIVPMGVTEAFARAEVNEDREAAETRWCDALGSCELAHPPLRTRREGRLIDQRTIRVSCPPPASFAVLSCIGGHMGWHAFDWLWGLRGFLDQLMGGVGSRRGRRDPSCLLKGETVDFWRVVEIDPPRSLLLQAEMRMPGRGWLRYDVERDPQTGGSVVTQTATFDSKGLFGLLYWYALVPFHAFVFNGVLRGIERECNKY
jgi:uncharacterized protein YbjT (DUF2867 family)